MTEASNQELLVFTRYRYRWSSGPQGRGAHCVLQLAERCSTPDAILAALGQDEPGDTRDAAIEFVQHFRVPVRDHYVDAVVEVQRLRRARLPVDQETEVLADRASKAARVLADAAAQNGISEDQLIDMAARSSQKTELAAEVVNAAARSTTQIRVNGPGGSSRSDQCPETAVRNSSLTSTPAGRRARQAQDQNQWRAGVVSEGVLP
jgi:hypothetical protein